MVYIVCGLSDVRDESQYSRFVDEVRSIVGDSGINLLVNNAGIYDKTVSNLEAVTKDILMSHFETNCVAPVLLTKVNYEKHLFRSFFVLSDCN